MRSVFPMFCFALGLLARNTRKGLFPDSFRPSQSAPQHTQSTKCRPPAVGTVDHGGVGWTHPFLLVQTCQIVRAVG